MSPTSHPARILVVDDEPSVAGVIARIAQSFGHEAVQTDSVPHALEAFAASEFDVVLTDLRLGEGDGLELLRHIQELAPEVPVVLITGQATIDSAMEAIRGGAYDYLPKPPDRVALGALLQRAIEKKRMAVEVRDLRQEIGSRFTLESIAGRSPRMLDVFKTVARVAPSKSIVLIRGESGTGKELVARALHQQSPRAQRRFVPVNVSALPEGLLETELFGHVRGAFTGATSSRRGLFEEAHLGTLFLDEIGDLSMPLQAKLLRVIQEHRVKPVGGNEEMEVDVRIVAATHRDLEQMVKGGRFREDLYYRLNVVSIELPPLRDRTGDIPILVEHFLGKLAHDRGRPSPSFSPAALERLAQHTWPGNVRELENVVERAVLLSNQSVIGPEALPDPTALAESRASAEDEGFVALDVMVRRYIERVLAHTGGNRTRAAEILGISRRTLHRMDARQRSEGSEGADDSDDMSQGATS
jgi:two-component system, NtrC family, response regulator AtoC